jgi:hypothetical protein
MLRVADGGWDRWPDAGLGQIVSGSPPAELRANRGIRSPCLVA